MYGQINDTKHTKTFISRPFGNLLALRSAGDFNFFAHESVGKTFFFASVLMAWSENWKQDFFFFRPSQGQRYW